MNELLVIGDSSIDLFMHIKLASNNDTSDDGSKLCFFHGSKIPVDEFETSVSGNAVNVAFGTHNLGIHTSLYTETGDDSNSKRILEELNKLGVDTKLCKTNINSPADVHAVIVSNGERTIFSYHAPREYSVKDLGIPKYIYYTSMGSGFPNFQKEFCEYLTKNNQIVLAFNPGTLHINAGIDAIKNVLKHTSILFLNMEETDKLLGIDSETNLQQKHTLLQKLGPKLTVITDGKKGASAYDGEKLEEQAVYSDNRPIVDKTGAGDAFSSGFLSAIIYGKSLKEALKWGAINSGCAIKVIGSMTGVLTKKEMENIAKNIN